VQEFARLLESGFETRTETAHLPEPLKAAMAARVRERIGPRGWLQFFDLFSRTPDLRLERMQFPCLVIGGEHDFAAPPGDCRALAHGLPAATVQILSGQGHFFLSQQPQHVACCIDRFVLEHL
jgi:pimeloyl-ACP methyl ester carboxylesterase